MDMKDLIQQFADLALPVDEMLPDRDSIQLRWVILESRALIALMEGK